MHHVLDLIDRGRLLELSGAVVHLFEQASTSFSDSILIWCVTVNDDGLDAVGFELFDEVALEFKPLIHQQKCRCTKDAQPLVQEGIPNQLRASAVGINHAERGVQRSQASDIQDRVLGGVTDATHKQQIDANTDIEIICSWSGCWQSCRLTFLQSATITRELLEDILDHVGSGACSLEQPHKFFDTRMPQIDMSSQNHLLLHWGQ